MIGRICILLLVFLALAMGANVILRFGFDTGFVKLQDFQAYVFAIFVLISIASACVANKHVRAGLDANRAVKRDHWRFLPESLLGIFSFTVIFFYSMDGALESWRVFEGSAEPGGLGGYFLVRTALPVLCLLMIVILVRRILNTMRAQ